MEYIYHNFARSVRWNTLESILLHGLMLLHQSTLFNVVPYSFYGTIGLLFSAIYLLSELSNLGLDASLGSWWEQANQSKVAFMFFVWKQQLFNYLFLTTSLITLYQCKSMIKLITHLDFRLWFIISGIIACESIKKTCKTILYLLFANHITATGEVLKMLVYIGVVWSSYYYTNTITLYTIFTPMLLISFCNAVFFLSLAIRHYQQLPKTNGAEYLPHYKKTVLTRLYNYGNQLGHIVFSGNMLIILLAARFGLENAGILKLINNIAYSITIVVKKTFGATSQALFAQTKNLAFSVKQQLFATITNSLYHTLCGIALFALINHTKLYSISSSQVATIGFLPALFYFIIIFSENFFTTYEMFFVTEDKSYYLAIVHIGSFCLLYMLIIGMPGISLTTTLACIAAIRIILFLLLGILAHHLWNLQPIWRLQPFYSISIITGTLLFFLIW